MTGAMYASIAGLRTHMQKLSVIGNNIANVNTEGYKKQRTVFRDSMYSMYSSGANGTATVASKNPSQLGYGAQIGSIDLNMSTSSFNPGSPMDCALTGDGFFLVGNKDIAASIDATNPNTFKNLTLTRVGDFYFGEDGYLSDGNQSTVYGFMCVGTDADGNPVVSDQLVPIRYPRVEKQYLNADGQPVEVPEGQSKPADGTYASVKYVVRYPEVTGGDDGGAKPLSDAKAATDGENDETSLAFGTFEGVSISATGQITGTVQETGDTIVIGYLAVGSATNPNGVSHTGGSYYTCGDGAGDLRISMIGGVGKEVYNVTNCAAMTGDDAVPGRWTVNPGAVKGMEYVNGSLAQTGDGTGGDDAVPLSRKAEIGNTSSLLMSGFLEAPNTDLAEEISQLITTQRGYQANTRIITVTDSMLEELVNMKR